jgi:ABC-2 type transport system permease protein
MKLRQLALTLLSAMAVFAVIGASLWNSRSPNPTDSANHSERARVRKEKLVRSLFVAGELAPVRAVRISVPRFRERGQVPIQAMAQEGSLVKVGDALLQIDNAQLIASLNSEEINLDKAEAWGKALGIAGALGALIIPATLVGVIALALTSENGLLAASASRLAVMFAGYLLYFGVFIGASLAVSARAPSSRLALVALLAFWIINGLIAPRAVADVARRVYPTPSAFAFQQAIDHELRSGIDGHDSEDKRAEALKQRVLKQYGVDKLEALPVSFAGVSLQEGEEHGNVVFDRHYGELWDQFERQNRLKQASAIFAPMLAINALSMGLAGTDFAQHRDFAAAAEKYRRMLVKVMNDDMTYNAGKSDFSYLAQPAVWQRVPDFEYAAPSTGWALRHQTISLALLALWFVVAMAAALIATKRMRVD